ncbi:NADP-dependent 3-hydroxy acid dehydrogenase YdfG [Labedella gwakjiensis]|uniref:NADP-dependent 3-hydroxy acid dehydrogenase YdfG n=1 Tax=Labedella gwakjiensis TaxID=390269 RepID=A0A2P8GT88_9MICO|nr:SDR family NAD(P)-dependent oxidoreductase [Labedella gwakjiensis]PSL37174.1 NADP-dependent 3-hydroxy acid dehydrogenase YdfG [Labedella gwakjiensis]RUQ81929.1 SDR family NAD(P)-dependent oxidoreductase [Labedella gwakjiensis]
MSDGAPVGALTGRVAVVFGATGWIGSAICSELVRSGASVIMVGRDRGRLDDMHRRLGGGDRIMPAVADVTSPLDVDDIRRDVLARFGRVDLLVVSSGVISSSSFEDGVPADWAEMIDVNLRGLLHASQTFAESLLAVAGQGAPADMVLIGSVETDPHTPRFAVFNAVSAAIKQLARTLRSEYGTRGMRVHIVEPGFGVDQGPMGPDEPASPGSSPRPRESSPVTPETIASVVALSAGLPPGANLAEVLLLPMRTMPA